MATVLEELGPPGILGTPSLSPAQGPTPPQEGKGSYRRLSSQARGPGQEDSAPPPPLQVGPGLRDFPIRGRTSLAVSPSPPPPPRFQLHHKALPLKEGGGHLGTAERCCPSQSLHSAILHTHTQALHTQALSRPGLPWDAAVALHGADFVSLAHLCQAGPWTPMRRSSRTHMPT